MLSSHLASQAAQYLSHLCLDISTRRVGSAGNQSATAFLADIFAAFSFDVDTPTFACIDWANDGARLVVDDEAFEAFVSPNSLACNVRAPLAMASTIDELEALDATGKILLLRGELAKEQLMPKNFPFYNPDEHQRIIRLLESKSPHALIAATTHNPDLAGGMYPFPLIEDGDFDIPSGYITDETGKRLAEKIGKLAALEIRAQRISSNGCNVIARKGASQRRIVLTAHVDTKDNTPGAIDDGTGIVILLLVAELLREYAGHIGIELAVLNGEDHYSAAGEKLYLAQNQNALNEILLCVNFDGVGYREGKTAYSLYECPDKLAGAIRETLARHAELVEGAQWYQGDHMLFVQNGVPALAFTSGHALELFANITHTPKDNPAIVDCEKLASVATAVRELVLELNQAS